MIHRLLVAVGLFTLLGSIAPLAAGEFNPVLNIGDNAPAWTDLPGVDGRRHALADLKAKPLVLVVFTCNSCDSATDYEDRIIAVAKKYADQMATVAINVNKIEDDSLPAMKERAESKGYPYPYLFDESQQIAKDYGATFTPEFFLLDRQRKIRYMGGFDDSSNASYVEKRFLEPAIEAVLKGDAPAVAEAPALGCLIRYERQRRTRPTR